VGAADWLREAEMVAVDQRGAWRGEAATIVFGLLAAVVVVLLYTFLVSGGTHPRLYDFHTFWVAGRDYLHGRNPYPAAIKGSIVRGDWFVYPAPVAALFAPLGALPYSVAAGLMTGVLLVAAGAALWLVGVRDWRCYVLAFGTVVLLKALNLGTITPLLMLAVAGAWRLRRRSWLLAAAVAAAILLKLFLWPLLIWTFATGRRRVTGQAVLILFVVTLVAWLPILGSLPHYPSLLHQLAVHEAWSGYGIAGLAASAGASHAAAALVGSCAAVLAGAVAWQAGRHLSERRALAATVAAAIAASPVVWGHYFALAIVCIGLCSPALSLAWFAPLALWLTPGGQAWASGWRIVLALAVLAVPLTLRGRQQSERGAASVAAPAAARGIVRT
jgi:alpha-1,2-mannosyltransferase